MTYHWLMQKISPQLISITVFLLGLAAMVVVGVFGYQKWVGADRAGQAEQSAESRQTQGTIERLTAGAQNFMHRQDDENLRGAWEGGAVGEGGAGKITFITYEHNGMPAYDLYFVPQDNRLPVYFVRGTYEYNSNLGELKLIPRTDMGDPQNQTDRDMEHLGLRSYVVNIRNLRKGSMIWAPQKPRGHVNRAHPLFAYMGLSHGEEITWQRPKR